MSPAPETAIPYRSGLDAKLLKALQEAAEAYRQDDRSPAVQDGLIKAAADCAKSYNLRDVRLIPEESRPLFRLDADRGSRLTQAVRFYNAVNEFWAAELDAAVEGREIPSRRGGLYENPLGDQMQRDSMGRRIRPWQRELAAPEPGSLEAKAMATRELLGSSNDHAWIILRPWILRGLIANSSTITADQIERAVLDARVWIEGGEVDSGSRDGRRADRVTRAEALLKAYEVALEAGYSEASDALVGELEQQSRVYDSQFAAVSRRPRNPIAEVFRTGSYHRGLDTVDLFEVSETATQLRETAHRQANVVSAIRDTYRELRDELRALLDPLIEGREAGGRVFSSIRSELDPLTRDWLSVLELGAKGDTALADANRNRLVNETGRDLVAEYSALRLIADIASHPDAEDFVLIAFAAKEIERMRDEAINVGAELRADDARQTGEGGRTLNVNGHSATTTYNFYQVQSHVQGRWAAAAGIEPTVKALKPIVDHIETDGMNSLARETLLIFGASRLGRVDDVEKSLRAAADMLVNATDVAEVSASLKAFVSAAQLVVAIDPDYRTRIEGQAALYNETRVVQQLRGENPQHDFFTGTVNGEPVFTPPTGPSDAGLGGRGELGTAR